MVPGRQVQGAGIKAGHGASARRVTCTLFLAVVIVAGLYGLALAGWSDVSAGTPVQYGISQTDLASISRGHGDTADNHHDQREPRDFHDDDQLVDHHFVVDPPRPSRRDRRTRYMGG